MFHLVRQWKLNLVIIYSIKTAPMSSYLEDDEVFYCVVLPLAEVVINN